MKRLLELVSQVKEQSDYEEFFCRGCNRFFYGYPKYTLYVRRGFGKNDFEEYKICSDKCLRRVVRKVIMNKEQ